MLDPSDLKYKTLMINISRYPKLYWRVVPAEKIAHFPARSVGVCLVRTGGKVVLDWHASSAFVLSVLKIVWMRICNFQQNIKDFWMIFLMKVIAVLLMKAKAVIAVILSFISQILMTLLCFNLFSLPWTYKSIIPGDPQKSTPFLDVNILDPLYHSKNVQYQKETYLY